jgi:hypothetical protein
LYFKKNFFTDLFEFNIKEKIGFLTDNLTIDEDLITDFFCIEKNYTHNLGYPHPSLPESEATATIRQRVIPSVNYLRKNKGVFFQKMVNRPGNLPTNIMFEKFDLLYGIVISIFEELEIHEDIIISNEIDPSAKINYLNILNKFHERTNTKLNNLKLEALMYYNSPSIAIASEIDLRNWKYKIINNKI